MDAGRRAGQWLSQQNLGALYQNGLGVEKDFQKAVLWHRKAVAQGNAVAQLNLGTMYMKGQGVDRNFGKAVELFEMAGGRDGIHVIRTETGETLEEAVKRAEDLNEQGIHIVHSSQDARIIHIYDNIESMKAKNVRILDLDFVQEQGAEKVPKEKQRVAITKRL